MVARTLADITRDEYIDAQELALNTGSRNDHLRAKNLLREHLQTREEHAAASLGIKIEDLRLWLDLNAKISRGMLWLDTESGKFPDLKPKAIARINGLWRQRCQLERKCRKNHHG